MGLRTVPLIVFGAILHPGGTNAIGTQFSTNFLQTIYSKFLLVHIWTHYLYYFFTYQ